jgi:hypothetical protein
MKRFLTSASLVLLYGSTAWGQQILFTQNETGGLVLTHVQGSKARQFEEGMVMLKHAMTVSDNPTHRQQAVNWKLFRAREAGPGAALYVLVLDPPIQNADYALKALIEATMPKQDADKLFRQLASTIVAGHNLLSLHPLGAPIGPGASRVASASAPSGNVLSKTGTIGDGLMATVESKVTETNSTWWRYAWKVTLRNTTQPAKQIIATVEFQDADGFPIDQSGGERAEVGTDEIVLTGFELIDASVAPNVRKVDLKVRTIPK